MNDIAKYALICVAMLTLAMLAVLSGHRVYVVVFGVIGGVSFLMLVLNVLAKKGK